MPDTARVEFRHVTLAEAAAVRTGNGADDAVFIALDEPPPVRTVLRLVTDDAARDVVVTRVVEVPEADLVRGCFARDADEAERTRGGEVGTEHLQVDPADEEGSAVLGGSDLDADGNLSMAMPAPVLVDADDDDDNGDGEAEGSEDGDAPAADAAAGGPGQDASDRGRRRSRRGRRRK